MSDRSATYTRALIIGLPLGVVVALAAYVTYVLPPADEIDKAFRYQNPALMNITPAELICYAPAGSWSTGLDEARGMAIQDGQVYLVGDTDLRVMDRQGKTLTEASLENFQPTAITLDERMIYLTDGNTLASLPVDQLSGSLKTLLTLDDPAVITSLAVADGAVFLADAGNRHVWRFDLQDKTRTKIGRRSGRAIAKFVIPSPNFDLLIDQAGLLRVVNPGMLRVEAYTRDGYFEEPLAWGQPGQDWKSFVGCCNPTHLAQLDDGRFVTVEKGTPRVKLYSAQGEAECIIAPTEAFNGDAPIADLATDSQGRVYVLDRHLNDVRIFQPNQATTKP